MRTTYLDIPTLKEPCARNLPAESSRKETSSNIQYLSENTFKQTRYFFPFSSVVEDNNARLQFISNTIVWKSPYNGNAEESFSRRRQRHVSRQCFYAPRLESRATDLGRLDDRENATKRRKKRKRAQHEQGDTREKKSLRRRFVYMLYSCTGGLLSAGSLTRSDSQTWEKRSGECWKEVEAFSN